MLFVPCILMAAGILMQIYTDECQFLLFYVVMFYVEARKSSDHDTGS